MKKIDKLWVRYKFVSVQRRAIGELSQNRLDWKPILKSFAAGDERCIVLDVASLPILDLEDPDITRILILARATPTALPRHDHLYNTCAPLGRSGPTTQGNLTPSMSMVRRSTSWVRKPRPKGRGSELAAVWESDRRPDPKGVPKLCGAALLIRTLSPTEFGPMSRTYGACAFDPEIGASTGSQNEVATKRALIEAATETLVPLQAEKLDTRSPFHFADTTMIDVIITETASNPATIERCRATGIEISIA